MKIGLIAPTIYKLNYPFSGYGGIEPVCGNLAVKLAEKGHDVTVFCPNGSQLGDKVKIVPTSEANINYNYGYEANQNNLIAEYLKTNQIDILHDHTHQKYIYLYGKDHPEQKICSTLHNQVNFQSKPPVRFANMIGISNYHALEASSVLGMHLEFVYNGIEIDKYPYREDKDDYYLFFSRISRFKGAHEAINCAKQLGVNLKVAGEDAFVQDPQYVMQVMQSCDGQRIKYLGCVTEDKKKELLAGAKALILPILWNEPYGLVMAEALACGTPVITMPRGAAPEIVQHRKNGYLCQSMEEIKMAMKLVENEIDTLACRERAKEFSLERMVDNYEKLYEKIMNGEEW